MRGITQPSRFALPLAVKMAAEQLLKRPSRFPSHISGAFGWSRPGEGLYGNGQIRLEIYDADGSIRYCDMATVEEAIAIRLIELSTEVEANLNQQLTELESEVIHWKSNHKHEVERARLIKSRIDLPIERLKAYDRCSLDKVEALEAALENALDGLKWADSHMPAQYLRGRIEAIEKLLNAQSGVS